MEILRSRVEALQSLANANEVCPSVDLYLSKIDQLEQEILNEKKKNTNQLEVEMASLKKQFSDQAYKQNNVDNTVIEGNFIVEEIPKESKNGDIHILDDSFTIVQTMGANQNANHNNKENYFALQLQEYKEKHSSNYSNYTRFHKQTERDSPLLEDSCIVVQRKDANQINNRNNKKCTQRLQRYEENQGGNLTIVQTMGANQNTNHNNYEDYFVLQLQDYKEKHSSNYTRLHKQIERDSPLLGDLCSVVQRKDTNQINNRNNNKKRTQPLQRYKENQCGNLTRFHKRARINNKNYKARMRKAHHHAWKPNNTPYNTNNENSAYGLGMISSRQRTEKTLTEIVTYIIQ